MPPPPAARAIFDKLAADFNFDAKLVDKFLALGLSGLHDFRYFVHSEEEIEAAFVTGVDGLPNPRLQVARLRHAWTSCVANEKVDEVKKQKEAGREEDEDAPLPALKINNMKDQFWHRYHLCLTPEEWPSEKLISKLSKALDKRTLEVTDLWTVKSMLYQKTTTAKRRRLTDNLYLQEDEEDTTPEVGTDAASYFNRMKVYFMALAVVGAAPQPLAPTTPEALGDDSTLFVAIPWDLLMKYQLRAEKFYSTLASAGRFKHLIRLDTEERAQWTHRLGTQATSSLGCIIKEVMAEREAIWVVSQHQTAPPEPRSAPAASSNPTVADSVGRNIVNQLRDGTVLCNLFQSGRCRVSGRSCDAGQHRCGHLLKAGRVCGSFQHSGNRCNNKQRAE